MIFYLKVNRNERYTYRNLQNWICAISLYKNAKIFIMCDNQCVREEINRCVNFQFCNVEFIESNREDLELQLLVKNTTEEWWNNAAYAHLTTFFHARENHYDYFWNIDADDTCICLDTDRLYQSMKMVEEYAIENRVRAFSLDMHRSRVAGLHWSFGVTFVDNTVDWFTLIRKHCEDEEFAILSKVLKENTKQNIDWFFTYLRKNTGCKIENFYFENMKFIHFSNDLFKRPINSGFYHWKDGKLFFPILYFGFGDRKKGLVPICSECIKLDIGIKDEEAKMFLSSHSLEFEDMSYTDDMFVEAKLRKQLEEMNIEVRVNCSNI